MEKKCPFCKQEVIAGAFAEADAFVALYNHSPILPGHSLVIPRKHVCSLFELSEEEISDFFTFARKLTAFLTSIYETEAYDWSLQEGEAAGQSIAHLHLHIIPRKPDDLTEGEEWYGKLQQNQVIDDPSRKVLNEWDYQEITGKLRQDWKNFNNS